AKLAHGLFEYSAGVGSDLSSATGATCQPPRTVITRPDGLATLFMPASAGSHIGMRTLPAYNTSLPVGAAAEQPPAALEGTRSYAYALTNDAASTYSGNGNGGYTNSPSAPSSRRSSRGDLLSPKSAPGSRSHSHARNPSRTSMDELSLSYSTMSLNTAGGDDGGSGDAAADDLLGSPLTMLPQTLRDRAPTATPTPTSTGSLAGCVSLLDSTGHPAAVINAQELAAFRTALSSSILLMRRKHVETITVFGAGRQAYWHIYVALLLRGDDVKRVNIINRSFARTTRLLQDFYASSRAEWRAAVKFATLSRDFVEYDRLATAAVRKADVLFCCTPATEPLFRAELLTAGDGLKKGRLVVAIGSYTPAMLELDPDVLRYAVKQHTSKYRAHVRHPLSVGVVVVDCVDACLTQSGEVVGAQLEPRQLVEIGELVMVRQEAKRAVRDRDDGVSAEQAMSPDDRLLFQWMRKGLVVYKSVGMGLMDILVGAELLSIARRMGLGTTVEDF
ncbi:hypothetical protein KEM52_002071, partial [Ascosphaera acerosa]